jgi:hypothetical protein
MQRQGTSEDFSSGEVMRLTGIVTIVLSIAVGLVAMLAFPAACGPLASLVLFMSAIFVIIGLVILGISLFVSRRQT